MTHHNLEGWSSSIENALIPTLEEISSPSSQLIMIAEDDCDTTIQSSDQLVDVDFVPGKISQVEDLISGPDYAVPVLDKRFIVLFNAGKRPVAVFDNVPMSPVSGCLR